MAGFDDDDVDDDDVDDAVDDDVDNDEDDDFNNFCPRRCNDEFLALCFEKVTILALYLVLLYYCLLKITSALFSYYCKRFINVLGI